MSAETFDAHWLALREPVDHRSRAPELAHRLGEWWRRRGGSTVLDLGSGTGSNLRYLAPRLNGRQRWTLVDHDGALLERAEAPARDVVVETVVADLAERGGPGRAVDLSPTVRSHVEVSDLVTASALLDLVSSDWIDALVAACAAAGAGAAFALSYDGVIQWGAELVDPMDEVVRAAVHEHQRRDKGLGPALGPTAGAYAAEAFRRSGFRSWSFASPWRLDERDTGLTETLVSGWADAATEQSPERADDVHAWRARRRATVASDDVRLVVGHVDVLALPEA